VFALIFSRDRAMQLDAALRSFLLHCRDAATLDLFVLYYTSTSVHARQYTQLEQEYAAWPRIYFVAQRHFRRDTLELLCQPMPGKQNSLLHRWWIRLGPHLGFLNSLWRSGTPTGQVLFLVDDNIFVRDFSLSEACRTLADHPDALGFSLRLGMNTTYSYPTDSPQASPVFELANNGILKYNWTTADGDYAYPLEVSSSLYRLQDVFPVLVGLPFENPNFMESRFARKTFHFKADKQFLLCYSQSVTFCNPVNKVQQLHQNRAGVSVRYMVEELAKRFDDGQRIRVDAFNNFTPTSCHQEVEFVFVRQERVG
jgi:hypothetical protein